MPAKSKITLGYDVVADSAVESVPSLGPSATFSSREIGIPVKANTSEPLSLDELTRQISKIPGVARAEPLSLVDLDRGSLSAGPKRLGEAVRIFGLDNRYLEQDPSIKIINGSYEPGSGLISAEAARALSVGPGGVVQIRVPGMSQPLSVRISGITDVSRAKSLFYSREGKQLEQFVYVRNSVIVGPEVFSKTIIPAFQNVTTAPGTILRSRPILEVDVFVVREPLDADPATALAQTKAVADAVNAVAPGQDVLIDNISNALEVASDDARTAKRMFVFLGLPGALLAAILTSYAGGVLASALRREQAILRIRGANRTHLLRMHALRTLALAAVGSLLGVALGLISAALVLSADALASASPASLIVSALLGAGVGFLATGVALYAAGRRSITRQISDERAQLASRPPLWRLLGIDFLILGTAAGRCLVPASPRRLRGCARIGVLRPLSGVAPASGDHPDRNLARRCSGAGPDRGAGVRPSAAAAPAPVRPATERTPHAQHPAPLLGRSLGSDHGRLDRRPRHQRGLLQRVI